MSNVRITPWQDGDDVPKELLAEIQGRRPNGELIGIDRLLLRSFPLAKGWNELLVRVRTEFGLSLEYRELIMLRVSVMNGAIFQWNVHEPAYIQAGGKKEKALALKNKKFDTSLFSKEELALIELTDQSTLNVTVEESVIANLKGTFGETHTVEAVATVAAYNMVSRFLVALDV